jgi:hypothetical protein
MTEKIVYVSIERITSDAIKVITPRMLDDLLEEGWTTAHQSEVEIDGRKVQVYRLRKREDRALARRERESRAPAPRRSRDDDRRSVARREDHLPGVGNMVVPAGGVVARGGSSFLGGGSDFAGLPGIAVGGSVLVGHAFSLGADAANQGGAAEDNPFPPGAPGHHQWLDGFTRAVQQMGRTDDPASGQTDDAYAAGKRSGKMPDDAEVDCPYRHGTPQYQAWLRGFQEAGGRVL